MTHNGESITMNDYPDYVVCLVCKKVGEHMKADEARLLPTLRTELANKQLDNAILSLSLINVSEQDANANAVYVRGPDINA